MYCCANNTTQIEKVEFLKQEAEKVEIPGLNALFRNHNQSFVIIIQYMFKLMLFS